MLKGLGGLGGLGDMAKMMKAATEMQGRMAELQADLGRTFVTGESEGGLVKVRATAKGEILDIDVDATLLAPSEKPRVEDLTLAAIRDAMARGAAVAQSEMNAMAQSLGLPPDFKLPF